MTKLQQLENEIILTCYHNTKENASTINSLLTDYFSADAKTIILKMREYLASGSACKFHHYLKSVDYEILLYIRKIDSPKVQDGHGGFIPAVVSEELLYHFYDLKISQIIYLKLKHKLNELSSKFKSGLTFGLDELINLRAWCDEQLSKVGYHSEAMQDEKK